MKKLFSVAIILGLVNFVFADPIVPRGDFSNKLNKAAGKTGDFINRKENFPKDYFLVNNNLPFFVGLTLHHPQSSSLGLSKKQIKAIQEIKKRTVPFVVKKSKRIKKLELDLAQNIVIDTNTAKSQYKLVDEISKLRTELTKAHLKCINEVKKVLSKEQYGKMLKYATKLVMKKSNKFRTDELVYLPHPGKYIKMGKIIVSKEQKQKINKEIKKIYAPIFQAKGREAYTLEKKVQKMVNKGKTKEDVKDLLDEIAKLKREAMDSRIDALNHLQKIMGEENWEKANRLTYK